MSRSVLAIAVMLLPLPALAQSAPASSGPQAAVPAPPQQASPEKRGFSIARTGASAPAAPSAVHSAAHPAHMTVPAADMHEAGAGTMKHHSRHHHHRHWRHHAE